MNFDTGWDGECDECGEYHSNNVLFENLNVYICPECLSEARLAASRQ